MALVEFAAPITSIRGSIGGWVFQRTNAGNIVRLKGGPVRASTPKQTLSHQNFIAFLQQWQPLTLGQKQLWDDFGVANVKINKFGLEKILTGLNWFQSINSNLTLVGEPTIDVPPIHTLPTAVASYSVTVDATKIEITFSPSYTPVNSALIIWATTPTTQTAVLKRSALKQISVLAPAAFTTINITAAWETAIGMSYPPPGATPCYSIGVLVNTIELTSGINSTGLAKVGNTNVGVGGIGTMIIGSTFIIG